MSVLPRTIKALKDGIAGLLTRVNLDSVTNVNNAIERALRTFQQKATIQEGMTSMAITLYDGVVSYIAPVPVFGSTIKDIRPVGQYRLSGDAAYRIGGEDFDRLKGYTPISGYNLTFETENGVNIMRIKTRFTSPRVVLDPMNSTTGWTVGGTASALAQDTSYYYMSPASLRFTLTGAGTGYIEKTLQSSIDMTPYLNVGVSFIPIALPILNLTSVELRFGSDSANYYAVTATQGQLGAWTIGDFLDTPFNLAGATVVGTPDITKIKYVRATFNTSGTITNIRTGYLSCSLPSQHKVLFTTTGIFSSSGVLSNFITNDNDLVMLNDAAYNIFEHECALTIGLQEGGTLAGGLMGTINGILNGARAKNGQVIQLGLYDKFRADNPSEDIRLIGKWYD